jgi:hypothetical protein
VLVDRLGVPFNRIRLYFIGMPPSAKRTPKQPAQPLSRAGGLQIHIKMWRCHRCSRWKVIEQGRQLAADILEASPVDIEFLVETSGGYFRIVGTDRGIHIMKSRQPRPFTCTSPLRLVNYSGTVTRVFFQQVCPRWY